MTSLLPVLDFRYSSSIKLPNYYFRFLCENTVEERIVQLQEKKKVIANNVLYGYEQSFFVSFQKIISILKYYVINLARDWFSLPMNCKIVSK